jgi:hypothetical protein
MLFFGKRDIPLSFLDKDPLFSPLSPNWPSSYRCAPPRFPFGLMLGSFAPTQGRFFEFIRPGFAPFFPLLPHAYMWLVVNFILVTFFLFDFLLGKLDIKEIHSLKQRFVTKFVAFRTPRHCFYLVFFLSIYYCRFLVEDRKM